MEDAILAAVIECLPHVRRFAERLQSTRPPSDLGAGPVGCGQQVVGLPGHPSANLAAAHFEIVSTGHAARNAAQRQRAVILRVVEVAAASGTPCEPEVDGVPCSIAGEIHRLAWQRLPAP